MTYLASPLDASLENEPLQSSNQRVATTALVCALAVLAVATRNLAATPAAPAAAVHRDVADVRIVDPAFCRDQTWPYIDQRCLKRVEPQQAASISVESAPPPMNIAPVAAIAPQTATPAGSAIENARLPIATAAPATRNPQPIPAESPAGGPAQTYAANFSSPAQTAFVDDSAAVRPSQKPHHTRHRSGFLFGFRF